MDSLQAARHFTSRLSESLNIEVFPYSIFYIFFEQYLDIWNTTIVSLSLALAAVFFVCLFITTSISTAFTIVFVIAMIIIDLMGLMVVWDIQLNAVSIVNLVIAIVVMDVMLPINLIMFGEHCVVVGHNNTLSCPSCKAEHPGIFPQSKSEQRIGVRTPNPKGREESVKEFVTRNLGGEVFQRLIESFYFGVYAGDPSKLSKKAAFGKVWRLEEISGSIIGGTFKMIQERIKNPPPPRDERLPKPKGHIVGSFKE